MKAKHLIFAVLILAGLLSIWLLLSDRGQDGSQVVPSGQATGLGEASAPTAEPARLVEPAGSISPQADANPDELAQAEARRSLLVEVDAPLPTWPESETLWLETNVQLPDGTPAGERAFVVALSKSKSRNFIFGPKGPLAALAEGREVRRVENVLAGLPVEANGSARLPLPPGTAEVWLMVAGDYVYSLEPQQVKLASAPPRTLLRPVLGARVSGQVQAPNQEPAPGMEVVLDWSINAAFQLGSARAGRLDRTVLTDADGTFDFRAIPVGRPLTVATAESPYARQFSEDIGPLPGEHLKLNFALLTGGTLRGRVVDEAGAPVPGAEIEALGREFFGNPTEELRKSESDAEGRFELTGISPGSVWIATECEGFQEQISSKFELANGQTLDLPDLVLGSGLSLSGTIAFPDGTPAVGARISVKPDLGENIAGSPIDPRAFAGEGNDDQADEAGAFRIPGLGAGPWNVKAELQVPAEGGKVVGGRWAAQRSLVRAPGENLSIVLEPPVNLLGRVVNAQGEPVPAFTVRGEREGSQWYMPPSETESEEFEDPEGRFVLTDLSSGKWTFTVEAKGLARSEEVALELPTDSEQEFVLKLAVLLAGRVVDPSGNPVVGAEVSKELEGTEVLEAMQGRGDWPTALSDGEGNFQLEGLAPGIGSIVAKLDGWAPSAAFPYELTEGQAARDVVLTLRRGGTISGEVFDASGKPANGCLVIVQMPTMEERRMTNADSRGRFEEAGLKPGSWQVQAFPGIASMEAEDGKAMDQMTLIKALKMTTVELADEAEEHVILGAPPADPVRVFGRVSLSGEPLSEALVSFLQGGGAGLESLKIANTKSDGRYEVQLDEPGEYLVTVQTIGAGNSMGMQNSIEFRRTIPKAKEHELDFAMPLGRITGSVVGPNRKPLADARVTLTMQSGQVFGTMMGGQYHETKTKSDGTYEILFLRPGEYTLAAGGMLLGGLLGQEPGQGRDVKTVAIAEGATVTVDFQLEAPGSVTGVVRDAAGKPVPEASIFLRDEQGRLLELFSFQTTNASGKFEYDGLAPGEYTVTARTKTLSSSASATVLVRAGESTETTVVVDGGTLLLVALTDTSGADIPSRVSVLDEAGREVNGMLSLAELMERINGGLDDKVQRVGPLPAGTYEVRAFADDGRSTSKKVTLSGQAERKLNLRLK
jgi:Carboxypeptidase regulatory-like domain